MSLKGDKDKAKQLQDKCQSVLNTLLRDEDNKYCVDCDSKGTKVNQCFFFKGFSCSTSPYYSKDLS